MIEYYKNVAEKTVDINEDLNTRLIKAAAFRAEYEELMNTKRQRELTTAENKTAQRLKSNIDYYESLRDKEFENLKTRFQLQQISEEEYYTQLAALRDIYFEQGSSEWAKYTIEITKYNSKIIEEQKKTLISMIDEINSEYDECINSLISKQDNMYNKLMGISDIYNKISINGAKDGESYTWLQLSNIDAELAALKNYNDALISAQEKTNSIFDSMDLDKDTINKMKSLFFEQLAELNIADATGFSNYLSNMDTSKLSDYLNKWVEKINLSNIISKNLYSDEANNLINAYTQDISTALNNGLDSIFSSLPETFYANGSLSAEQFKEGFLESFSDAISEIFNEINKNISPLISDISLGQNTKSVVNNSNYNIYGASNPAQTLLEIQKQDTRRKMLVGD